MKLLIEIWGNYHAWKEVTYTYNDSTITSTTTIPLLLQTIKPDKSLIIVADTLLEYEIANNTLATELNNTTNWYRDAIKAVEHSTKQFIINALDNTKTKASTDTISVLVTPAVGTFNKTKFIGNPNNFFSYLYYIMAKAAVTIAHNSNDKELEIYVDITHGMNYMTMITYRTIKDICSILAYFFDITFVVLNSDPFVGSDNIHLNINQIEKVKIKPQFNFFRYPQFDTGQYLRVSQKIDNDKKALINKKLQNIIKEQLEGYKPFIEDYYCFASSVYHALPLYLVYFYPDITKLKTIIDIIVEIFFNHFMYITDSKFIIQQQVDFTPSFLSLLQLAIFAQCLQSKYNITRQAECPLPLLNDILQIYIANPTITSRIYRELDKLQLVVHELQVIPENYVDYGLLLKKSDYIPSTNVDNRNFFAHSGFGYNNTLIKNVNKTIYIKPKEESLQEIKKVLIDNLPLGVM